MGLHLLVDGDNVLYRSAYQVSAKHKSKEPLFGPDCVAGFLSIIRSVTNRFFPERLFIIWDSARSKRRSELFPKYKAHRISLNEETRKKKYADVTTITRISRGLGARVISFPNRESDDVIALLANFNDNSTIVSNDSDFHQLIRPGVSVYDHMKDRFFSSLNFCEFFPYKPKQSILYKAIVGDQSDNIPGVPGLGPKMTAQILSENPNVTTFEMLKEVLMFKRKDRKSRLVLQNESIVRRNLELMDIQKEIFTELEIETIQHSTKVATEFDDGIKGDLKLCGMGFIVPFFDNWSSPFRRLV